MKSPRRSGYFTDHTFANEFGLWLKHLGRARLEFEFGAIQARFGTADERLEDLDSARTIGRQLHHLFALSPTINGGSPPGSGGNIGGSRRARAQARHRSNSKPPQFDRGGGNGPEEAMPE
jgi:hypothetical protein